MSHGGERALDATLKLCSRDRHLKYKKPDPGKELEKKETFDKSKTTTGDQPRKRTFPLCNDRVRGDLSTPWSARYLRDLPSALDSLSEAPHLTSVRIVAHFLGMWAGVKKSKEGRVSSIPGGSGRKGSLHSIMAMCVTACFGSWGLRML